VNELQAFVSQMVTSLTEVVEIACRFWAAQPGAATTKAKTKHSA
jgi:hypothetical protein